MSKHLSHILTAAAASLMTLATSAYAQVGGPQGSGPIANALDWIQGTLMGKVATTVAVIAVAAVGFMMLMSLLLFFELLELPYDLASDHLLARKTSPHAAMGHIYD